MDQPPLLDKLNGIVEADETYVGGKARGKRRRGADNNIMTDAIITPQLLRWAIERSRLSPDIVAQNAQLKLQQLTSWQSGDSWPTLRQAQKLARVLRVPFGYLFLSSPPKEEPAIPDLRTTRDANLNSFSPEFHCLFNDVLQKQQWYRDYLQDEGAGRLDFIGSFSVDDDVKHVAENISTTLGINETLRNHAVSWEDFLRKAIRLAEDKGILILRSGVVGNNTHCKLSVDEFRGFVISDVFAPLIFLNGRDAKAAQIFTLAHELSHLWIGQSGISNLDLAKTTTRFEEDIEPFCNRVAEELLVPKEHFLNQWKPDISIERNLRYLVRRFRVSSLVVLRRAYNLKKIKRDEYLENYKVALEAQVSREDRQSAEPGGDFYATLFARNSSKLTTAIVSAAFEDRLLYRDAARFLGVKVKTLDSIANRMGLR